jgi:hypothetical protein
VEKASTGGLFHFGAPISTFLRKSISTGEKGIETNNESYNPNSKHYKDFS